MITGDAIPMVRAKAKGYRMCISRATSVGVTASVVRGTGARHLNIYGTYRSLIVRSGVTRMTLPGVMAGLGRRKMRVHKSRETRTVDSRVVPTARRS